MKPEITVLSGLGALALAACAGPGGDPSPDLEAAEARESYSLGLRIGAEMQSMLGDLDDTAYVAGIADAFRGTPRLTSDQVAMALASRDRRQSEVTRAERLEVAEENRAEGEAFRTAFGEDPDVVTLESGLQYKVLTEGDGKVPEPGELVTVHYRGSFVDGTEFDSSYARQEPLSFPVDAVIPGWTEALTRMAVGSRWKVVLPPELAYGEAGAADFIGPESTLVFEMELIEIG